MKRYLIAMAMIATVSTPALSADVGVSLSIGQPGFYGQIDIGDYPRPQLIYRQPMMIERVPMGRDPIYLNVPPGHRKNWKKHCRDYNACGERVYFVQNSWYDREYAPRYQQRHTDRRDGRGDDNRDDSRGQRDDHGRGDDRGGHGKGR